MESELEYTIHSANHKNLIRAIDTEVKLREIIEEAISTLDYSKTPPINALLLLREKYQSL